MYVKHVRKNIWKPNQDSNLELVQFKGQVFEHLYFDDITNLL